MTAISVIVPVYNAEKYIYRCIDSILLQSFHDFEILLIDDGSTDNSGKICDEYALKDSRIKVFHKKNGGVSSARQFGIEKASGEYTIHIDSDDWIDADMLNDLYNTAKLENADMVICDYFQIDSKGTKYCKQQPSSLDPYKVIFELFQQLHGSCWNKLIKSVCYNEHGIKFPTGVNILEDKVFIIQSCYFMQKIAYLNKAYYHYDRCNESSLTHSGKLKNKVDIYEIIHHFYLDNNIKDKLLLKGLKLFRISTLSEIALYGGKMNDQINYRKYINLLPYIHRHKTLAWSHRLALYFRIFGLPFLVSLMLQYRKRFITKKSV